jgi:peptidoglycan/xylan/chitin deacetylase (PgdA/CDA1 family)
MQPIKTYFVPTQSPFMALTFDDGPSSSTPIILNLLKQFNVKATFFLLLDNVVQYPNITKQIIDEGHEIGIHSINHRSFRKFNKHKVNLIIEKYLSFMATHYHYHIKYIRPPFGTLPEFAEEVSQKFNLQPIGWTLMEEDWKRLFFREKSERFINKCSKGKIAVMHDGNKTRQEITGCTTKMLKIILSTICIKNIQFTTVSDLISKQHNIVTPTFSDVPLLHKEIYTIENKTNLLLCWDINHIKKDQTFFFQMRSHQCLLHSVSPFPSPNAMKEWEQIIPIDNYNPSFEFCIKNKNVFSNIFTL